jgi:two-component system, chemotaxis family, sensor histidine kinase and response regulator PixL
MSQDKELEIRRQFLDEAEAYLDTLDQALIGLSGHRADPQKINAALRAAHSIKGGAGMMGFTVLSGLAHRLEDSFKVLKVEKALTIDATLENLLLSGVDSLRQVITCDRQSRSVDGQWLTSQIEPIFDRLHQQLGNPQEENAASLLATEDGQDIIPLLFETEVEGCLQRLEAVLNDPSQPYLAEELDILAQELGGLGEMLNLAAFTSLCASVTQTLASAPDQAVAIAQSALKTWRRSQALVMVGQLEQLPTVIEFAGQSGQADVSPEPLTSPKAIAADLAGAGTDQQVPSEPEFVPFVFDVDAFAATDPLGLDATIDIEPESFTVSSTRVDRPDSRDLPLPEPPIRETQVTDYKVLEANGSPALEEDADNTVRVPVRQLNHLNDLFGELTIERNGLDLYLKRLRNLASHLHLRVKTLDRVNAKMRQAYDHITVPTVNPALPQLTGVVTGEGSPLGEENSPSFRSNFDALEMDQYNDLHSLSQQVMETIVQIQEIADDIDLSLDETEQTSRTLNKTAKQLQTGLTQLRMRPLSDVVDRFPRALRELSLQYGKQVNLAITGSGTLIDRNILETLNDPLMHLLRNAFDHGIEDPATRRSRGKSEAGTITITAQHQNNRTIITVRDDGEGIPLPKIRARAEQMGLDPALLAAASDADLLSLIFEPGFSTSEQVTTLSGRGVGMDVVRSNLKEVRGEISVNTKAGEGTTFTLSLPFTLSVVHILLTESNGMLLAFPTDTIKEMFLLKPEEIIASMGSEVLNWQGQIVQLVRLQHWLKFNCPRPPHNFETPPTIRSAAVLMVESGTQMVGLQVDRCWGEQEATIRRIEGSLPLPEGFSSCTILGDGRVVPLVNVPELLRWVTSYERPEIDHLPRLPLLPNRPTLPSLPQQSTGSPSNSTILVVDDSINVRRFLALTLERAGYQIEQAKDGQEALEKLEAGLAVQAVICDIEMPRLDGYGFLAKVKANPRLATLPVAMLTSRSGEKHRQLATSLGASAYFAKPYNEQTLLRTLAEMTQTPVLR